MKKPILAAAVLLSLLWPVRVSALEVPILDKSGNLGTIGFVDTQRLFKLFPETTKARENFEEAVRQAEDQINLRKADILRLRKDIDELKIEREAIVKSTPMAVAVPPAISTPSAAVVPIATSTAAASVLPSSALHLSTAPAKGATPAAASASTAAAAALTQLFKPTVSTSTAISQLPGFAGARPSVSSTTAAQPLIINLPGATAGPVVVAPPSAPPIPAPTAPALPAPAITTVVAPPAAPPAPAPLMSTAVAQAAQDAALAALDERIAQKTRELERKQAQARDEQESAEKNLLDLESRRSEILLGKIYKAVQEVARREGVSVVVDKTGILYGGNAVDLTEKVLKYLKGG